MKNGFKKILAMVMISAMILQYGISASYFTVYAEGETPAAGTELTSEDNNSETSEAASDEIKTDDNAAEGSDTEKVQDQPAADGPESAAEIPDEASEVPEDVPDDANTDNSDPAPAAEEPDKAEAEPEENPEETTAGYSERSGVEAAEVAGEAAESKTEAKEALSEETDIPSNRVKSVVKELFYEPKVADTGDDSSSDEKLPPRSGDGSNIENISAKWITPDTVNNDDPALLYVKPNKNETQSVRLQINYALSGEHSYDPGDIVITVPAYIFKDRNGKDYGNMIIPYPEDPSKKGDFNWRLVGDHYEITNTKRMSAATKGFIQFQIEGMEPNRLVDMATSAPFDALIEVTTHKGNLIALRSNELTAQFDTEARLTNVNKRNRTVTRVKASQIPESQRIEGEEEYIKVDWYVWGSTWANTFYKIDQIDQIPQAETVSSRKVVADEDVKNVSSEISLTEAKAIDPSYKIGDTVTLKESDVKGFVIGGKSPETTSVTKNDIYHGASDGNGQYYSFSTAYPASQFQKDVEYTFHNAITYTVTEDDPEVKENTNPNVQKEDPKLVTTKTDKVQVTWSYRDPEWIDPTGHFMVTKNGNDDTNGKNITHRSTYTTDDLHIHYRAPYGSIHGWYGIYPSALNELQDAYEENGEKGSVRLSYTIDTVGYALPWMYDGGVKEFHEGELPARIIGNYNRPVTITTKDTGISIGRNGDKLKVLKDYTFEEIEFPESPYVYTGKPQNIEPDGSWTALDHGDGTFKYSRDNDKSNWPDITLQIQRDGKWEDYAVASWKSGSRVVTLTSGGTAGNGIVKVPSDTQNFRTIVNLKNTEGGEGATEAIQAAVDYDVRVVVNLNSTKDMIALIEKAFSKSNTPSMEVYNSANMLVERSDEPESSQEREIVSIERDGYDSIRGYTTDTAVYPYKSSTQKLKEVDYEARTILIHYTAKVEERSVISDKKTWEQAVADKRLDADTSCVWRDLLPRGVTPLLDTVTLRKGDTKTKQPYTIENYMGTHRTLLVVEAELEPTPQTYRAGDMYYYEDVPTISFDAIYDFESLIDYGYELHNVIAYESGNKQLGTIKDYSGEPDDPTLAKHKNTATEQAFNNKDPKEKATEKKAMTNLDTDPEHDGYENFVYAGAWTKIDILSAARTSLYKDVQVNNDGIWSEGTYYKDIYGDPPKEATEGGRMRTVYEGGQYTYRLRVMSDPSTISTDLIIYDSLENFYATGSTAEADNDPIDYIEPGDKGTENDPHWQGVLRGIDTSQLEKMGCAPVIYYSTIEELQLSDESDPDKANATNVKLGNREVWIPASEYKGSLEDVKAIAVDCSNASEEADEAHYRIDPETGARKFMLPEMESIVVNVNMQAPSGDEAREYIAKSGKWGDSGQAYNNAYLLCTSIDKDNPDDFDPDNFVRKDYTKVGLKEYSIKATKKWNDDDNRDGKRPDKVTFRLFADGVEVKDSRVSPKVMDVAAGETEVTFDHIPYTQPDGTKIIYTVVEDPVALYTSDQSVKDTTYQFTNIHTPERTRVSGEKTWEGDEEENRPASIDIELYANGKKLKTQTVKPDANGNWKYDFANLFKYEDGKEIKYTIKEIKTPDTGNKLDSYIPSYDGNDILNTYHPYGDLKVNKTINGATEVSREKEFDFTFTFSRKPQSGSEEAQPVFDEYEYEILDGDGNAVTGDDDEPLTGTVKTNDTVSIKGGQTIHVKEIPQGISYDVTEAEASGFKITGKSGDSGTIKPNQTAEASFTNTYSASGRINLEAKKVLENRIVNKNQFSFELYEVTEDEDGGEIEEIKANGYNAAAEETITREDGTIDKTIAPVTFGVIRYSQADHGKTFKYRMKEVIKDRAGYTYSKEIYEVNVTVTDKGDGSLEITPVYTDSEGNPITDIEGEPTETPYFTNEYKAAGKTTLLAWKSLPGRDLKDDEFTFELLDENGDPVMNSPESSSDETGDGTGDSEAGDADQGGNAEAGTPVTATSKANATVTFSPEEVQALNYTEKDIGKTFYYAIREKAGTDDTVIYDKNVFGYAVKIYDNDDGTLYAEQTLTTPVFDKEDPSKIVSWTTEGAVLPTFNNKLKDGGFSIAKTVVDSPDANPAQEFRFRVRLVGDEVTDDLVKSYTLTKVGEDADGENTAGENTSAVNDNNSTDGVNGTKRNILSKGAADSSDDDYGAVTTETSAKSAGTGALKASVEMQDGEFEIILHDGEKATFDNIPAGITYQVFEDTPKGWILVESENVSGTIEPLITAEAKFKNQYAPGQTQAQFYGTKMLDHKAAKAGKYSFVLKEEGKSEPVQTVTTSDGGFIQFDPITFKDAGVYKYTIEEVNPEDDTIDWDTHKEKIKVTVEEDEDEDLVANVEYDSDGVRFTNKTRPGILKLTKRAKVTEATKDDEFTFRITLNNADGMPLGSDSQIYWYTEKASADNEADNTAAGKQSLRSKVKTLLKTGKTKQSSAIEGSNIASGQSGGKTLTAAQNPVLKAGGTRDAGSGAAQNFAYTGSPQTFTAPASGYYKFEAWGASGGDVSGTHRVNKNDYTGGRGGYAGGKIYLTAGTTIYVYVGGKGNNSTHVRPSYAYGWRANGGWNGGGTSNSDIATDASGGGATDFRLTNGTWNNFDSLKSRIMVAGGGGGAGKWDGNYNGQGIEGGNGGAGGGTNGINGTTEPALKGSARAIATGGTQTAGGTYSGSFGQGAVENYGGGSGGGGYYGGGMQSGLHRGGGGGSGFVSGLTDCNAIREDSTSSNIRMSGQPNHYSGRVFSDAQLIAGNRSFTSPDGMTETGHTGNGYARITMLSTEITYDPNGASGESVTKSYDVADGILLPHPDVLDMEYADHVFIGWAKNKDAELPDYEAGEILDISEGVPSTLYAVWMSKDEYLINLDANGGYVTPQLVRAADIYTSVTLPEPTKPGTDVFAGWNTEADGSGTMFYDTVIGEQIPAQPGEKVTLYAQWADGVTKAKYKVRHFKQNASGSGYSLYETENLIGNRGDIVSPAEKEYEGYVCVRKDPDAETYTLPEQGEPDLVVDFYYDLCTFEVVYDGNGATSGQMNDPQEMKGGVQYNLLENRYSRKGYLFTGWNTEADGSGRTYVDKQKVKNLSRTNGDTVTLYAQWHSNEDHVLEPTNGEIIVKCKAGEIIVIPDLPAGTTYTIEEIDLPAGWTQTGSVGTDGSIIANGVSDATVTNAYKAEGDAIINAHKTLEGAAIEEGQFTFELFTKDDKDNETIIETVTNGAVDANAEVDDADGNLVDNPYYGTSIVQFTPFTYSQADIGKTYTYYVREKGSVDGITLDEHVYSAEVKVEDAGGGNLTAAVTWTDTQGGLEPVFKNKMKPAELNISKSVISDASAIPETEFTFTVDLLDENGEPVEGTFETKTGSKTGSVQSGGTVKLKGGETVTISGLPHGVTYKVTEAEVQNWEQTSAEGTEGMLEPGKSYEASFENKYTPPEKKPYTAEGSVVLKAKKTVTGGTISEEDDFTFELLDEEGNSLQSKGCDTVSTEDNKVTQSDITFNAIRYTLDDLPYPEDEVEARVEELLKPYQAAYDAAKAEYEGQDPKPEKAFMSFEEYIRKNYEGKTLNKLLDELTEQAESEAVREKTFTYLVREINGGDADVHYDSHTYYYKVRAWDNGQGKIETEVTKWKPGAEGEEDAQVNDIEFINSRSTQIKVYKRWSDHGNQDGYRPDKDDFAGMIHLMNGDTEVTDVTPKIIEEEDGNLAIVYEDLPVFDDQGNEITYSVKEDGIDHYTAKDGKDTAEDGETITNVHEPETMKLTVNKVWDDYDDKYGKRAGAVLTLYKTVGGAESAAALPVPVGTTDDWSFTWENLPVKEEGKVITYSVKELLPDGTIYESSVSDPVVAEDGAEGTVTVTNTCNDKTEATVRKIWDDNNNKAGKRLETLTVKLLRKVGAGKATQAVDENGDAITVTLPVNGKWEATVSDLPKYDPDANTISYSWQEVQEGMPEGYVLSGTSVSGTATTLTNKFNPPKSGDILIRKVDKDGKSISGAVFEVYRLDGDSRSKLSHDKYSWLNSEDQFTVGRKPFSITGLEDGTYEIYEVKAPEGYGIDMKYPVIFTIWNGELLPELNVISDNVRYELLEDGKYQFSIMNSGSPGVKTGDNSHLILYAGTMLTAVLLMLILVVRRRKRSE